ncbi:MAG: hypothetical protein ACM3UY_01895 [Methanocella sp.]
MLDSAKLQRGFAGIVKDASDDMPEGVELRIKAAIEGNFMVLAADNLALKG